MEVSEASFSEGGVCEIGVCEKVRVQEGRIGERWIAEVALRVYKRTVVVSVGDLSLVKTRDTCAKKCTNRHTVYR